MSAAQIHRPLVDFPGACTRVLDVDCRSAIDQELIPAGTEVLFNSLAPDEFRRATPQNQTRFGQLGSAWTEATRQRVAFPGETESHFDPVLSRLIDDLATRADEFASTLDRSMRGAADRRAGAPVARRGMLRFLSGVPPISRCDVFELEPPSDDELFAEGGSAKVAPTDYWRKRMQRISRARLYRLSSAGGAVDVVVCPLIRLRYSTGAPLSEVEIANTDLDGVRRRLQLLRSKHSLAAPRLTMLVVGAMTGRTEDLRAVRRGSDEWVAVACPRRDALPGASVPDYESRWVVGRPVEQSRDWAMAVFRERVLPEDRERRAELVLRAYRHWKQSGDGSLLSQKRAKALTRLEEDAVLWAFDDLRKNADAGVAPQRDASLGLVLAPRAQVPARGAWRLRTNADSLFTRILAWATSTGTMGVLLTKCVTDPESLLRWREMLLWVGITVAAIILSALVRRALPTTELAND